jgi:hypothetical protein
MEDNSTRHSFDSRDADGSSGTIGDPADSYADDPLGDEAAFPSTWQHLAGGEGHGRD